jgi:hypothetical protein
MDIINALIESVFYDEDGAPVTFNPDGTMSFYSTKTRRTIFGKYVLMDDGRIKTTLDQIMYIRPVMDEATNCIYIYNSFGGIFASSRVHITTRAKPTVAELHGHNIIPEPLVPAMIVVYSIQDRIHEILCKRHWIWKDQVAKIMRFIPNGSVVELRGIHNTPVEVGSWTAGWYRSGGGINAIYQPPGDWRNVRKVITGGRIRIDFSDGRKDIYMYVMVDPKDESLVYMQQELSVFKAIDDDTVNLVDMQGRQACCAERVK